MIDSSTNLANTSSNKPHNYHEQSQIDQTLRLREVLKTLPPFVKDYFRAMEPKSSARTRINYAYDIRVFFHFLNFCIVSHAMAGDILCCFCILLMIFHWCHYMQFPLKSLVVVVIYVISYRSNQRASVIKTLFIIHFSF